MKLDVFSLLVLLGALQALFFGVYLLFSPSSNKLQKKALAFFILILSYNGFETLNWSSGLYPYILIFDIFPFVLIFGLGPSFYLYFRSFYSIRPVQRPWRHYYIIWLLATFRAILMVLWILHAKGKNVLINPVKVDHWFGAIAEPLSVLSFTVYYLCAVNVYRKLLPQNTENGTWLPEEAGMIKHWLSTLLITMGILCLIWQVTVLLPYVSDLRDGQQYYVIEILVVVFIYWVGFAGFQRTRVIYIAQQKRTQSYFDQLTKDDINTCLAALEKAMEQDLLYLDPDLNISVLSTHTGINAKTLSAVLNQQLKKGFNEYVNAYRLEAVKSKMLDRANDHLTITGMAFESGFNSQPTFQRVFKSMTGMTPREFQSKNQP